MKIKNYLLVILLSFTSLASFAQNDSTLLNHAVLSLSQYYGTHPVEKTYLQLDRSYYMPGDTVWYKSYTVTGAFNQLSVLSGVLHCELINNQDSIIDKQSLKLTIGTACGNFDLPHSAKPGIYHIRAYTNWMRNSATDYFYNQEICIGGVQRVLPSSISASVTQTQPVKLKPDVQFFPEGGELVNGLRSKVAAKAVNANGLGENVTGVITDNEGNEVAAFATQHLGMGVFPLQPQSGKTYKAKITCADGSRYTVDLPAAQEEGYTITLNNSQADSIYVKIAANDKLFEANKNTAFYLLAQAGGKVFYTAQAKLVTPVFTTQIAKSRFPSGIVQFTLFSQAGEPLNERIIFVQNDDTIKMAISAAKTYSTREKVKIEMSTKGENNKAVVGSFSVSVINESRVPVNENSESTILNNLLLTSDLKGYIEQPNYYFNNANDQTRADLDILMLTQGYRRFEWQQILKHDSLQMAYQPEKALEIEGMLKTPGGKPVPNGKVILAALKDNFHADTVTDINGNFKFTDLDFSDTSKIILRARKEKNGSNVMIYVKNANYPLILKNKINTDTAVRLTPEMINNISDYQAKFKQDSLTDARHLKEVIIKGKAQPKLAYSANPHGPGNADQVFTADKLSTCITLLDCLNGRVMDVSFGTDGTPHYLHALGLSNNVMLVLVDGMVEPGTILADISVSDVYSVEIFTSGANKAIYGNEGAAGVFLITTKRGGDPNYASSIIPAGLITYNFEGFYKARAFYSPKYDAISSTINVPDLRSTIYWNPNIITDKDGKASFEFYNNDTKGIYRIVVEGLDENGYLGRKVYRYKVE